jgi:hypothetical protein
MESSKHFKYKFRSFRFRLCPRIIVRVNPSRIAVEFQFQGQCQDKRTKDFSCFFRFIIPFVFEGRNNFWDLSSHVLTSIHKKYSITFWSKRWDFQMKYIKTKKVFRQTQPLIMNYIQLNCFRKFIIYSAKNLSKLEVKKMELKIWECNQKDVEQLANVLVKFWEFSRFEKCSLLSSVVQWSPTESDVRAWKLFLKIGIYHNWMREIINRKVAVKNNERCIKIRTKSEFVSKNIKP